MEISGRELSRALLEQVRAGGNAAIVVRAIAVAPGPVTQSYVRIKERAAQAAGMQLEVVSLPEAATTEEVISAVNAPGASAVIVQLPLPVSINEQAVLESIPAGKDADVLSSAAQREGRLLAPVAAAVREILSYAGIDARGQAAVVVGEGKLVGAPVAAWLRSAGANVLALNEHTFDAPESQAALRAAGIIVSGAGVPHLITPQMVRDGVALIDAGTSEKGGAIVGDIDPACAQKASVYTPVPGGVGPVAVACLFQNALALAGGSVAA